MSLGVSEGSDREDEPAVILPGGGGVISQGRLAPRAVR